MKGLEKRGGIWRVRVAIPADLRGRWGKSEEIASLNTSDENEALRLGAPRIADIRQRIKDLRNPTAVRTVSRPVRLPSREEVFDTIQAWRHDEIDTAYRLTWAGETITTNAEEASRLRYLLQHNSTIDQIEGFNNRLADVLNVSPATNILSKPDVREWMRAAWSDVEGFRDRFQRDDYTGWPEEGEPAPVTATPIVASKAGMKLSALRDQWDAVKPLDPRQKGYIRRLIDHLGDRDIASVTPSDMDAFLIELKRFPLTKKPSDDRLAFGDLIALYDGTDQARLHPKTIWNWTVTFKAMFAYAVSRRLLDHNPAGDMMKKPSAEEANDRAPYAEADLDRIFTRPLFQGFAGRADAGYRDEAGSTIVRDAKYWLPIVALHTGMRLEELASLKMDEVIDQGDVIAFDLTRRPIKGDRSVKNGSARRIVPLHHRLHDLGFVAWMRAQKDFVFADLTPDAKGKHGSQFSKWWGLWCAANAEKAGEGIDDPSKTFHSFRHSFKRAARQSPVKEEVHDLLTGHAAGNTVARGYGAGVDLAILKAAMDQIEIRWP